MTLLNVPTHVPKEQNKNKNKNRGLCRMESSVLQESSGNNKALNLILILSSPPLIAATIYS